MKQEKNTLFLNKFVYDIGSSKVWYEIQETHKILNIFKQGFSAGIFLILVEKGISGLFFVLTLLVYVLRKNFEVVLIFLLYLLAMPLYVNNLFWLSTLILWTGSQLRKEVEA